MTSRLLRLAAPLLVSPLVASEEPKHIYFVSREFQYLPGSDEHDHIVGRVDIVYQNDGNSSQPQIVKWDLHQVSNGCMTGTTRGDDSRCRLYLANGNPCKGSHEPPPSLWNPEVTYGDPWRSVKYKASLVGGIAASGVKVEARAQGEAAVATGLSWDQLRDSTLVILDGNGEVAACGAFEKVRGCLPESEWRKQGVFDFSHAFEKCGTQMYCTKGHPDCQYACNLSEDCEGFPMRVCDSETKRCRHKHLLEGGHFAKFADVGTAFLFAGISGLSMSVGIGGGGLFVPLLSLLLGFGIREATALSQACLVGGSSSALLYNLKQRHPSGKKPMIDYDLVLVMGPALLVGSITGSILHSAMPTWFILVLLDIVLFYSCQKTFVKACETWSKENQTLGPPMSNQASARLDKNPVERVVRAAGAVAGAAADSSTSFCGGVAAGANRQYAQFADESEKGQVDQGDGGDVTPPKQGAGTADPSEVNIEMKKMPSEDVSVTGMPSSPGSPTSRMRAPQFPVRELSIFLGTWLVMIVSTFLRGGKTTTGLVGYCSPGYWVITSVTGVFLVIVTISGACRANAKPRLGPAASSPAAAGSAELVYNTATVLRISISSVVAGTIAALCGIGGGMIMGPILLQLGVMPQVQSASTGTTLFVMSTSTVIAYMVQGLATPGYSLFFACATGMGAVIGRAFITWLIKKLGRQSIIVFLLASIIVASVLVMTVTGIVEIVHDVRHGQEMGFQSLCV